MIHYIYIVTCRVNGKQYIGKTARPKQRLVEHRYAVGRTFLAKAFRAHGKDAFIMEMIACSLDNDAASEAERALIIQYGTKAPGGYNLTDGGEGKAGAIISAETRAKMSATHKGKKITPAQREHFMKIRHLSGTPEALAKISAALKGRKFTPEWRAKISASFSEWVADNPEWRAEKGRQTGDLMRGGKQTPEQIAARKASRQATIECTRAAGTFAASPEVRAKRAARMRGIRLEQRHVDALISDQARCL